MVGSEGVQCRTKADGLFHGTFDLDMGAVEEELETARRNCWRDFDFRVGR